MGRMNEWQKERKKGNEKERDEKRKNDRKDMGIV